MDEATLAWLAAMGATIVHSDGVGIAYFNSTSPEETEKLNAMLAHLRDNPGMVAMKVMPARDFRILDELEATRKLVAERKSARMDIMEEVEQVAALRDQAHAYEAKLDEFGIGIDETVDEGEEPFKDPVKQAVADALCDMVARSTGRHPQDLRDTEAPWLKVEAAIAAGDMAKANEEALIAGDEKSLGIFADAVEKQAYDAAENYAKGLGSIWGDANYRLERSRVEEKEAQLSDDHAVYQTQKTIFDHLRRVQAKRNAEHLASLHSYPDEPRPTAQALRQAFMNHWSEHGEGDWSEDDHQSFKELNRWAKRIERR